MSLCKCEQRILKLILRLRKHFLGFRIETKSDENFRLCRIQRIFLRKLIQAALNQFFHQLNNMQCERDQRQYIYYTVTQDKTNFARCAVLPRVLSTEVTLDIGKSLERQHRSGRLPILTAMN